MRQRAQHSFTSVWSAQLAQKWSAGDASDMACRKSRVGGKPSVNRAEIRKWIESAQAPRRPDCGLTEEENPGGKGLLAGYTYLGDIFRPEFLELPPASRDLSINSLLPPLLLETPQMSARRSVSIGLEGETPVKRYQYNKADPRSHRVPNISWGLKRKNVKRKKDKHTL